MSHYTIKKLDDYSYSIQDSHKDTMYLLLGNSKAVLIDCGLDEEPLLPVIQSLTNLPVILLATHGHLDHIGRSAEFEEMYMDLKDALVYQSNFKSSPQLYYHNYNSIHNFTDQFIDIGRKIEVIPLPGHTPGSVIFVDDYTKRIYTGDAIGSGCGVWMQVPLALGLDDYILSLQKAYDRLVEIGVDSSWHFHGGHAGQELQSRVSSYNPLCLDLIKDMIDLNKGLIEGTIAYEISNQTSFINQAYYACYQRAEIIFTLPQIECCKINLNQAIQAMNDYLNQFDLNDSKIRLKQIHTYEVMKTSQYICEHENFNLLDTRLAVLIALLHDIGRFEQLKRFNSFFDTYIDHAKLGVEILKENHFIRNFIQCNDYDEVILNAIYNHSLYQPLTNDQQSLIIRDSDKLDNFRVKNIESISTLFDITQEEFENEKVSENILNEIKKEHLIKKADRSTHLDMYVSYLAFVYDLNYQSSYQWLKEKDYVSKNIDRFYYHQASKEMNDIKNRINTYIEDQLK